MIQYPGKFSKEEDGSYFIQFIDFPSLMTQGNTMEELVENAEDILSTVLTCRMEENKEIPLPSKIEGEDILYIQPLFNVIVPLSIKNRRKELGMTQTEVAERMNVPYQTYQEIERFKRIHSITTLDGIAEDHWGKN